MNRWEYASADALGLPRTGDGQLLDGFTVIGARVCNSEWAMRRDDPDCDLPARPRSSYPDPVTCFCGAVFCPLRTTTRYCSDTCVRRAWRTRYPERTLRQRRESNARARAKNGPAMNRKRSDARRRQRKTDPTLREKEARWAREYRARKKAAAA